MLAQNIDLDAADHARYFVINADGEWRIRYRDEMFGPYKTQSEALLFAIDAAHGVGKRMGGSEVLIEGEKDHFHVEWTYGHSPYPPRNI
jgi:hypothetical protein